MILLIFGICILMIIGGCILDGKTGVDSDICYLISGIGATNNKTIRDLRDKQIKGDVYRWWLYFGGKKND